MLKRFLAWLELYVANVGFIGLVEAVLGILAFGSLLSALFGTSAMKAGALIAAMLAILGLFVLLLAGRRELRRQIVRNRRLLANYCDIIKRRLEYSWRILRWEQVAFVEPNGDTRETVTFHLRVECEELYFFRFRFGPSWDQPERYRKNVNVKVRTEVQHGVGGTRWDVSHAWLSDGRLETLAHFYSPARRGTEMRISLEWYWPGKCFPLLRDRDPDVFTVHFMEVIDYVRYVVVLPPGEDAFYDPMGFTSGEKGLEISAEKNGDNRVEVVFTGRDIAPNRKVGMRLDLK